MRGISFIISFIIARCFSLLIRREAIILILPFFLKLRHVPFCTFSSIVNVAVCTLPAHSIISRNPESPYSTFMAAHPFLSNFVTDSDVIYKSEIALVVLYSISCECLDKIFSTQIKNLRISEVVTLFSWGFVFLLRKFFLNNGRLKFLLITSLTCNNVLSYGLIAQVKSLRINHPFAGFLP